MLYIYTLSFNGIPFYVGMTNNPVRRYKQHYLNNKYTTSYLRHLLYNYGRLVEMNLIWCNDNSLTASKVESKAIYSLYKAGFNLINRTNNRSYKIFDNYIHFSVGKLPIGWFKSSILHNLEDQIITLNKLHEKGEYQY